MVNGQWSMVNGQWSMVKKKRLKINLHFLDPLNSIKTVNLNFND